MERPRKMPGESLAAWVARIDNWSLNTAEGRAYEEKLARDNAEALVREERARMDAAGIPPRAMRVLSGELGTLAKTGALDTVRLEAKAVLLVLAGGSGSGKTVAACWALSQNARRGKSGLFVTAAKLARWPRYDEEEMDRLLEPALLVIDDLGTEFLDERGSFLTLLQELISERCMQERRTIITTNLLMKDFRRQYEERIASRVAEFGGFYETSDPDLRRQP